jgi:hypothetical protein
VNDNSGFHQFNFPPEPIFNACRTDRGLGMETIEFLERGYNNSMISSWKVYSSYIIYLENFKILFDSDNYFKESASFFIENGNPDYHSRPKYPINQFPGIITKIIGYMNFEKISYFIKYSTIYSEEQISKLSNISVKPIK